MKRLLHKKTLVIEVGIGCNNQCIFCYQEGYRHTPGYPKWMSTEEIRRRLQWGAENNYDEVSFTGGEPTIRPDFLDLVKFARSIGYRRVAVTTNGWMLGRPDFFRRAVEAGLTSMGVSIHGPDALTHESLTRRPGSFARAIAAIRNAVRTFGTEHLVRLNTFTLVTNRNIDRLHEMALIFYQLGVRLMVFQPVLVSKSNFEAARALSPGLEATVKAVAKVAQEGIRRGFKTKLYNLPPCLFRHELAGIELDWYPLATFREHDRSAPGSESLGEEAGYLRLSACRQCVLHSGCPGVHVGLLPQEEFVLRLEEALEGESFAERKVVWVAGTDMLEPQGVYRVARKARLVGFEDVRLLHGGLSAAGTNGFISAAEAGGASEVIFVHHGRQPSSGDRILALEGNNRWLLKAISETTACIKRQRRQGRGGGIRLGLLVTPDDTGVELLRSPALETLEDVEGAVYLRPPWRGASGDFKITKWFLAQRHTWSFRPVRTVMAVPSPGLKEAILVLPLLATLGKGLLRFDISVAVVRSPLLSPFYAILNWSDPRLGGDEHHNQPKNLVARTLAVEPITESDLRAAQMQYDARLGHEWL